MKISPVGFPTSAVGFSTACLDPGWISTQWCDFLPMCYTLWKYWPMGKDGTWKTEYNMFYDFSFWYGNLCMSFNMHEWGQKITTMNQETSSEWLERRKAELGRLQGSHRVPGTSVDKIGDKASNLATGVQEKVTNNFHLSRMQSSFSGEGPWAWGKDRNYGEPDGKEISI